MTNRLIGRACTSCGRPRRLRFAGPAWRHLHFERRPRRAWRQGMGLLSIIQKTKCSLNHLTTDKNKELRILFLGLDNAGKTTTLKHFMHEPIDTVSPTLGFSIRTLTRDGYVPRS